MEFQQFGTSSDAGFLKDSSRSKVYSVSQGLVTPAASPPAEEALATARTSTPITIDAEVLNLITWLAQQQGMTPELALKKAVATAAYIHEITTSQGGTLLVQRKDKSIGEIVLN
ncbi:MAG: hypothetical protein KGQ93_07065 [Cyanobacteria bacterium REEB459]|nr:hypothetical protein [Cyanobacteria bacterium REEB459]